MVKVLDVFIGSVMVVDPSRGPVSKVSTSLLPQDYDAKRDGSLEYDARLAR